MNRKKQFSLDAERVAFDLNHRKTIRFNMKQYDAAVDRGKAEFSNLELAKQRCSAIKESVLENWDSLLLELEKNLKKNGSRVLWAQNEAEVHQYVQELIQEFQIEIAVKSKSMITEELEINDLLESLGVESLETDLGEFIVQTAGEKPYHIVTPAMHKSKEDVAKLFHQHFKTDENSSPQEITVYVRDHLRKKFLTAGLGISGANFLLADSGAIALTENEGNAYMTVSFPKVHLVIAGIDKIIPKMTDLGYFWPVLATHGTGQKMTVYNSIISGPAKEDEQNGPEQMIVILVDNGRTNLFAQKEQFKALKCIRCGACLNACPVYKNVGGYTYAATYSGPIGAVITPHLQGMKEFGHLSFASTLCGKCDEVCPVKIPLSELLLYNRRDYTKENTLVLEKAVVRSAGYFIESRWRMDFFPAEMKNVFVRNITKKLWGKHKKFPTFKKSFTSK